jgi:flavin-binding protein dodecin
MSGDLDQHRSEADPDGHLRGARSTCLNHRHTRDREPGLSNRTYRVTEIVGTSSSSLQDAIDNGVQRACQSLRHVDWLEVVQIRGHVRDDKVEHFQVTLKLGFRLEDT